MSRLLFHVHVNLFSLLTVFLHIHWKPTKIEKKKLDSSFKIISVVVNVHKMYNMLHIHVYKYIPVCTCTCILTLIKSLFHKHEINIVFIVFYTCTIKITALQWISFWTFTKVVTTHCFNKNYLSEEFTCSFSQCLEKC